MTPRPPLRIGYLGDFAPRKLGTGEGRLMAFAQEAARRGHRLTVFSREPVHPDVVAALAQAGMEWQPLSSLERNVYSVGRHLARNYDVLQLNMIPPRSRVAVAAALAVPTRLLFVDRVSGGPGEDARRAFPFRTLDRLTMVRIHEVAGITEYVRLRAERRFGFPHQRTRVIYNGVDETRFKPPSQPRPEAPLAIACVANLIPQKGVDVLLLALSNLDADWTLSIVGDGPERPSLERLATELGLAGRVRFLGLRDDVPDLLASCHVLVHPAIWREALGNTVLEGMASECVVIASRTGGIPELLRDGTEGILVPPGDRRALTTALRQIAYDPSCRTRLGVAGRRRVLQDFTLASSVGHHLDWIEASAVGAAAGAGRP